MTMRLYEMLRRPRMSIALTVCMIALALFAVPVCAQSTMFDIEDGGFDRGDDIVVEPVAGLPRVGNGVEPGGYLEWGRGVARRGRRCSPDR